jgi:hypothetical protein
MLVMLRDKSSKDWISFYSRKSLLRSLQEKANRVLLKSFQKVLYRELCDKIDILLKRQNSVALLSAGSGLDFVGNRIKKKYGDSVRVTVLDISEDCVLENERLFGDRLLYRVGDVFSEEFCTIKADIVYNTGLLEHFSESEQGQIISNIRDILPEGGYFVTLNPFAGGTMYIALMEKAKRKGVWEFGEEVPIRSLSAFTDEYFSIVSEYPCCSLQQMGFLVYWNKPVAFLFSFLILYGMFFYSKHIDDWFGKWIGYYGLMTVFERRKL